MSHKIAPSPFAWLLAFCEQIVFGIFCNSAKIKLTMRYFLCSHWILTHAVTSLGHYNTFSSWMENLHWRSGETLCMQGKRAVWQRWIIREGLYFIYRSYSTGKFYGFGGRDNFLREKKNLTLGSWLPCQWLKVLKNLNELLQETQKFARAEVGQISKFQF